MKVASILIHLNVCLCAFIVVTEKPKLIVQGNQGQGTYESTGVGIGDLNFHFVDTVPVDGDFLHVEEDAVFKISDYLVQKTPVWNLDRIDQRNSELDSKYYYHNSSGSEVFNYILDTGIDINHTEFEGRALWGANFADNEGADGCMHPHGTHVAGTIGSKSYGVAKKTNLISVKVLDCEGSGSTSGVLKGISFVMKHKVQGKGKVINMSLGGPLSVALNKAVQQATQAGIFVVTAAGNENSNACNTSPASEKSAITVGAFEEGDRISYFSNWGKCVDVFAPGSNILSTVPDGKTDIYDGTSSASPHVAGVVSLILSTYGEVSPGHMKKMLTYGSTKDGLKGNLRGSPNNALFSLI